MINQEGSPPPKSKEAVGHKAPGLDYFDTHPDAVDFALSVARRLRTERSIIALPGEEGCGISVRPLGQINLSRLVGKTELTDQELEEIAAPLAPQSITYDPRLLEMDYHEAVGVLQLHVDLANEFNRVDLIRSVHRLVKSGLTPEQLSASLDSIQELIQAASWAGLSGKLGAIGLEKLKKVVSGTLEGRLTTADQFVQLDPEDQATKLATINALGQTVLSDVGALQKTQEVYRLIEHPEADDVLAQIEPTCADYFKDRNWSKLSGLVEQMIALKKSKTDDMIDDGEQQEADTSESADDEESESMQRLREELEQITENHSPKSYNTADDPSVPPAERDKYPPSPEKGQKQLLYEVRALDSAKKPVTGHARSRVKSKFDRQTKQWIYTSKQSLSSLRLTEPAPATTEQQVISGRAGTDIISLPVPAKYCVDYSSLSVDGGAVAKVYVDQNGCFFLIATKVCNYHIKFWRYGDGLERTKPLPEDIEDICSSPLSNQTEQIIGVARSNSGGNIARATVLRQYLLNNHYYPGGGNLDLAIALQYKLLQTPPAEYINALDGSEYLECKSANTLFIAMARKAGVPARLVEGYRYTKVVNNIAQITTDDGHAWAEVWDDVINQWVRFDATPEPKPEDLQKNDQQDREEDEGQGQSAEDGGNDPSVKKRKSSSGRGKKRSKDQQPTDQPPPTQTEGDDEQLDAEPEGADSGEHQADSDEKSQFADEADKDAQTGEESSDSDGDDQEGDQNNPQNDGQSGDSSGQSESPGGQSEGSESHSTSDNADGPDQRAIDQLQKQLNDQQPRPDSSSPPNRLDQLEKKQRRMDDNRADAKQQAIEEKSFEKLRKLQEDLLKQEMTEKAKQDLQRQIDEKIQAQKQQLKQQLEEINKTGFIDEAQKAQLRQKIDVSDGKQLDQVLAQIDQTAKLHREYVEVQRRVLPLVDMYFDRLARVLPKELIIGLDELANKEDGEFDEDLLFDPDARLTHEYFHPPSEQESREPRLIVMVLVDLSLSMELAQRLPHVRKLLVFFCELFDRITHTYGPIRFAIHTFAKEIVPIKNFDHDYSSDDRYLFHDGAGRPTINTTVKARLMQVTQSAREYTHLLEAIQFIRTDLDREVSNVPDPDDYAKLVLLLIDGEDSYQRSLQIRQLVSGLDPNYHGGFYPFKALLMGDEALRAQLLDIFNPGDIEVANDFAALINQAMTNIEKTMKHYFGQEN